MTYTIINWEKNKEGSRLEFEKSNQSNLYISNKNTDKCIGTIALIFCSVFWIWFLSKEHKDKRKCKHCNSKNVEIYLDQCYGFEVGVVCGECGEISYGEA
jgi:hypothetical protein